MSRLLKVKFTVFNGVRQAIARYNDATLAGVYEMGEGVFELSQERVVRDTEELALSAEFGVLESDPDTVVVSYNTSYAERIHEDTTLDAKRKARAKRAELGEKVRGAVRGRSKYLESAFNEVVAREMSGLPKVVREHFEARTRATSLRDKRGRKL